MDHHRSYKDTSVVGPWTARGLLGGLLKEWDDVTILQLLFFAGTVADRSEWFARCTMSSILYLGQLQHMIPHTTISVLTEPPSFFNPVYLWCNILCGPASARQLFFFNLFFFGAFSLRGRNREWSGRKWPPSERGTPRGCISPRLTLIHSHNIWMCDDDLYQQICVRPNGVLAQCRKREKSSHRKSLFTSLCAILLMICKDLYLSILTW